MSWHLEDLTSSYVDPLDATHNIERKKEREGGERTEGERKEELDT